MITKKRLLELIERGATIYEAKYGNINPVDLKRKIDFIGEDCITFEPYPDKYKHHKYYDKLYETEEDARIGLQLREDSKLEPKILKKALELAVKECIKHKFCPDDTCFVKNMYGGNCKYCLTTYFKLMAEKEAEERLKQR